MPQKPYVAVARSSTLKAMNKLEQRALDIYRKLKGHHRDPFNMETAQVFIITENEQFQIVGVHQDVYEGLEALTLISSDLIMRQMRCIGLETCGWAAPISKDDDETPPSMHRYRRRCRLITIIDRNMECASAIGFSDDPVDIITDGGNSKGALDDSLKKIMACIIRNQAASN